MYLLPVLAFVLNISFSEAKKDIVIQARNLGRHKELGVNYGNFKAHKYSYLDVDKVEVVLVHKLKECGVACVNHCSCFSFNIAIRSDNYGHFICELLATDKYKEPSKFVASGDFHHFSIATPCLSEPCRNGAICFPRYEKDTYTCICRPGYTGRHCETDIDDCVPGRCKNGATCVDLVNDYRCTCAAGWNGKDCETMADCTSLKKSGTTMSGTYTVNPDGKAPMAVYCDMVTDGGGWTVIQRRLNGSVDFYLDWNSYKRGFGNLSGEFWLGNDNIHRLTASGNTVLRVELEDWSGNTAYAVYGTFMVDDESNRYKLTVGNYSGTAGDALAYHNGMYFTTKDRDNDQRSYSNCAQEFTGAWWYNNCHHSNLNGQYLGNKQGDNGVRWSHWKGNLSLKRSTMMIRSR